MIKLSTIKPNPNNPRVIKDHKFEKLKKSINEFPKMMELRPMVINDDNIVLGGNMRLKALKDLGYKDRTGTAGRYSGIGRIGTQNVLSDEDIIKKLLQIPELRQGK